MRRRQLHQNMQINQNASLLGGLLAYMLCNFGFVSLILQLDVYVWFILMLQVVAIANIGYYFCYKHGYASCSFAFLVNEGPEDCSPGKILQYVRVQSQNFEVCTVNLVEGLNCNVSEFLVEEELQPPLRS